MDFLKSYAHQVVSYHPESARDELFEELYSELCEEYEDWHNEHPGSDEVAFLDANKEHPMRFATRLAPEGSAYLIGPQFYYSFISALKIATIVTFGLYFLFGVIAALDSGAYLRSITRMLLSAPETLIWVYASIFGVFIALEKSGDKASWLDNWKAKNLIPIDSHQTISKFETFFDLGVSVLGLLWLLDIVHFPSMVRHEGTWISGWSFNLPDAFWVIAGVMLALDIVYSIFRFVRNFWSTRLRLTTIANNFAWIVLLSYAGSQAQLLSLNDVEALGLQDLQTLINRVADGILYGVVFILAVDTLHHGWKLFKSGRPNDNNLNKNGSNS